MQKLVKRTVQAQRQAGRRAKQRMERLGNDDNIMSRQRLRGAFEEMRQNVRDARQAARDKWEMGPLAPKRDLGFSGYGNMFDPVRPDWSQAGYNRVQMAAAEKRCAWAGGVKQLNLAVKDRVVILDGPDKGKIDRISSIDAVMGTVKLEKHHQTLATVREMEVHNQTMALPLPISSIRLVHPITNPETGVTRDVVINHLKSVPPNMQSENMTLDRWEFGNKWDRLVPGINVVVPWPAVDVPELRATDADTLRDQVTERTFHYGLTAAPMPEGVLDELRNKYSPFRTRHEQWYLEKKAAEDEAKQNRHHLLKQMQTPLEEYHEKQRELRDTRGEPELTPEMLEKIGEVMARNSGVTKESSAAAAESTSGSTPNPQ